MSCHSTELVAHELPAAAQAAALVTAPNDNLPPWVASLTPYVIPY